MQLRTLHPKKRPPCDEVTPQNTAPSTTSHITPTENKKRGLETTSTGTEIQPRRTEKLLQHVETDDRTNKTAIEGKKYYHVEKTHTR